MKTILIIITSLFSCFTISAQILNNEFDEWLIVDTFAQPYEDLIYWNTNNNNDSGQFGFANTPNVKIEVGNDIGVAMSTSYLATDGFLSGIISQEFNAEDLIGISYLSKCDSIFELGACVINLYDESEKLLYTDSVFVEESDYSIKSIDIAQIQDFDSDLIKLEFKAHGEIGYFQEFQGYSEFNLLHVNANYTTNTSNSAKHYTNIYPNPFTTMIHIDIMNEHSYNGYEIFNTSGKLIQFGNESDIETNEISIGLYYLLLRIDGEAIMKKVVKM